MVFRDFQHCFRDFSKVGSITKVKSTNDILTRIFPIYPQAGLNGYFSNYSFANSRTAANTSLYVPQRHKFPDR
jgi:hypothetical protein